MGDNRLKWHITANLRWLAGQSERPARVPCGMLTGAFLIAVADKYEQLVAKAADLTRSSGVSRHD